MVSISHQDALKKLVGDYYRETSSEVRHMVGTWTFTRKGTPPSTADKWLWRNVEAYAETSSGLNFSKRGGKDHATDDGVER